ncbi:MAG: hypothetical protein WA510_01845 [Acidobacteriaceae bacterium]
MNRREQRNGIFSDLGVVLERLWNFHQAMHFGLPVENAEESMEQMKTALTRGAHGVQLGFSPPGVVSSHSEAADSRLA